MIDDLNFLDIKENTNDNIYNEFENEILIVSILRIIFNNTLFCISFQKQKKCQGLCKYKNKIIENCVTLLIDENKLISDKNKIIEDIIYNNIFEERSKICDQAEYKYILNIKYIDIILPKILIFHIDLLNNNSLKTYKGNIDSIV